MAHSCIIGLLNHYEDREMVTADNLKERIKENIEHNEWLSKDPVFKDCKELYSKIWSMKDYADKRKNTDLTRFDFCPKCGKKIDWAKIRSGN